jgi:hypothetical protein
MNIIQAPLSSLTHEEVEKIADELMYNAVSIPFIFVQITGSWSAAALLGQIRFWARHLKRAFYKTNEEFCSDLHMGINEFKAAKKKLLELGLIKTEVKGTPPKTYYFYDSPLVHRRIIELVENQPINRMASNSIGWNSANALAENQPITTYRTNIYNPPVSPHGEFGEEIHTANFENLRSSESVPVNVKESSSDVKSQPHNRYSGKSGDVFEEDCEGRSGPHDNNLTPPTQSVNASQSVNNSNTRGKNFIHQGENSPLDELYQVGVNEMIPTAWFNIATRKNIPTDKVNDVFGKFKHFYRGREYTKIDWNEKWTRWCDNERQFKDHACQEEKPIEVVVDHSESVEVRRVRQEILRIVGDATYKSWYASCEIKLSSTNIEIIAPTKFNMGWIETNGKNLDSPLRASLGKNVVYKHKQQNTSREARMAS